LSRRRSCQGGGRGLGSAPCRPKRPANRLRRGRQIRHAPCHLSDLRYARTASASCRVMRKGGIGGLGGRPVREIPVVNSLMISASVPGGEPAIRGSRIAQAGEGYVGRVCVGPPISQRARSGLPRSSRCVWQRSHIATPSTIYLPRSTRACSAVVPTAASFSFAWAYISREPPATCSNKAVSASRVKLRISRFTTISDRATIRG
jgi:hypothetical protein